MLFEPLFAPILAGETREMSLDAVPYFVTMGFIAQAQGGQLTVKMPFKQDLIGAPVPPRLHGGTLGALLETAGTLEAMLGLIRAGRTDAPLPKPIGLTVDFVREGRSHDTYAAATVTKLGKRIANVTAQAWQQDRDTLVASAVLHLLVGE
jgi:uncharacterized protein (TIGR00369 family)